jgi:hypothetical protein
LTGARVLFTSRISGVTILPVSPSLGSIAYVIVAGCVTDIVSADIEPSTGTVAVTSPDPVVVVLLAKAGTAEKAKMAITANIMVNILFIRFFI